MGGDTARTVSLYSSLGPHTMTRIAFVTSTIEDENYRLSLLAGYGPILEELERRGIQVTFQEYDSQGGDNA